MKSDQNEPSQTPRRAEKGWVIVAWAAFGFLLAHLLLAPPPTTAPAVAPAAEAPAAKIPSVNPQKTAEALETVDFGRPERPSRDRPESRDRVYRDLSLSPASSAALPERPSPAPLAPAAAAAAQPASGAAPAEQPAPIPGISADSSADGTNAASRPGRPDGRPDSRAFVERPSLTSSD